MNEQDIPYGYNHKATSEGFNNRGKVVIYYSNMNDDYFITINENKTIFITKAELELFHHAATDIIDMNKR